MHNYISASVKNPVKTIGGDTSFSGNITINGDDYILLLIADGVSSAPKDWLASRSTVRFIQEYLKDTDQPVPQAFLEAVKTASHSVLSGVDNTYGILSALSALLYAPVLKKGMVYQCWRYAHIWI